MGCVRTPHCPLFPYLNASLSGWREAYCDSDDAWNECERYRRFLAGQPVPLGLLPNGKVAIAIEATAQRAAPRRTAGTAGQRRAPASAAPGPEDRRRTPPYNTLLPRRDVAGWWRRVIDRFRGRRPR